MAPNGERAQGASAWNSMLAISTTPAEAREVQQYEKLLRFRDDVVGGNHPRIKPAQKPAHPPPQAPPTGPSQKTLKKNQRASNGGHKGGDNARGFQPNPRMPLANASSASLPGLGTLSGPSSQPPRGPKPGRPEINPVLLEKSQDLIKAELQLRRQRIERALKEDFEKSRSSQRMPASEQVPDFDIASFMDRAMNLAKGKSVQSADDTAANGSASHDDSFDDNTFYSSQHDTPTSNCAARVVDNESENEEMRDGSPYEPALDPIPTMPTGQIPSTTMPPSQPQALRALLQHSLGTSTQMSSAVPSQPANMALPGFASSTTSSDRPFGNPQLGNLSPHTSGTGSRSDGSGNTGREQADRRDLARVNERLVGQALGRRESPVVRSHDLSPIAPQPAHVSPLAFAHQHGMVRSDLDAQRGTPAQVAALRKQHSTGTSPESSPQGSTAAGKKQKKKKRKADRPAVETTVGGRAGLPGSPVIKPEPRSVSPIVAPSYARPNKRQRQSPPQRTQSGFGGSYNGQPIAVEDGYQDRYQPRPQREERVVGYERVDESGRRQVEPVLIPSPMYERAYYEEPRSVAGARQGVLDSPQGYSPRYATQPVREVRPVHALDSPHGELAQYYQRMAPSSRIDPRPAAYRGRSQSPVTYERGASMMPPPRALPARIIMDEFGREYYEPARPARRVVTQPELVSEHRVYRDGPPIPPPPGEYMPSRVRLDGRAAGESPLEYMGRPASTHPTADAPQYDNRPGYERRAVEEPPREYLGIRPTSVRPPEPIRYEIPIGYERRVGDGFALARSASVRPIETIRYEGAREYGQRVGSVRPDLPAREYAASVHPDMRRDAMQPPPPGGRGYSVVPGEMPPQGMRRDFGPPPGARYHGQSQGGDDDVVFLDQGPMYR
ncbi:hypothetical protein B0T18DRAFT_318160 [Schizothecium vesticola]|uniref:Uncharacterized protein n=1 Tax=Schizothecium vesticola TaxID=314040 RepID=A0AA40F4N7_9PEZI|nr:hypothetical protein B0T18DRAFT_318160 [Schizothecium vesticola]